MGKVSGRTPTCTLLLTPELVKDIIVTQCFHILINISKHMGVAAKRVKIATPRPQDTRKSPKRRSVWTGVAIDAQNDGLEQYRRNQQIIIEFFYRNIQTVI